MEPEKDGVPEKAEAVRLEKRPLTLQELKDGHNVPPVVPQRYFFGIFLVRRGERCSPPGRPSCKRGRAEGKLVMKSGLVEAPNLPVIYLRYSLKLMPSHKTANCRSYEA